MSVRHIQPSLVVLLDAVAFVLPIVCANVANLLLARDDAATRDRVLPDRLFAWRSRRNALVISLVQRSKNCIHALLAQAQHCHPSLTFGWLRMCLPAVRTDSSEIWPRWT